jgi:hypothetical protein
MLVMGRVAAQEDQTFPYTAYVSGNRCQIRCGPGDDHYVTETLNHGDAVEVHRREGGWLAIRPPGTSFSWVAQRDVSVAEGSQVGSVAGASAVSWIGSTAQGVVDHKWLIQLDEGERVWILGKERRAMVSDGKSDVYYRISPPSGEFRWIHEDDVVGTAEELVRRDPQVELAEFQVALPAARGEPAARQDGPAALRPAAKPAASGRPSSTDGPAKDDFFGRYGRSAASQGDASVNRADTPRTARLEKRDERRDARPPARLPDGPSLENLDSGLAELDAALSLVVAQPVEKWDFAPLRSAVDQLSAHATSTLERARIQVFLDKVRDFESLRTRHALFQPSPGARLGEPSVEEPRPAARRGGQSGLDPRFDGIGWLLPVHSAKPTAPPYALLDREGNILHFVSPAPGLNLNRYLRKEVGIFGQKEQATTVDKPHLTAHRVVELERHRGKAVR